MTQQQQRPRRNRTPSRMPGHRWSRSSALWAGGAGAIVAVLIAGFILISSKAGGTAQSDFGLVDGAVLSSVTRPSAGLAASVGTGGQAGNLNRLPGTAIRKDGAGKPLIVYVGADYCPFCAAERWSMVMALARFGTFSNLHKMTSSSTDVDPDTRTFTFHDSTYASVVVAFQPVEVEDRSQQALETPSAQVSQILNGFDRPPYTVLAGGLPFLDVAGRYVMKVTGYDPALLRGLSWEQIASGLADTNNPATRAIVGNANYLTAAICSVTGDAPPSACSPSAIQHIEATLAGQNPVG